MSSKVKIIMAMSVPFFVFVVLIQSFRFKLAEKDLAELESVQLRIFEENKRLVAKIAVAKDPCRVMQISRELLELDENQTPEVVHIVFGEADCE
jgi:hypothetical protein